MLFTSTSVLDLFSQIPEFQNFDIKITEEEDGSLLISVNDNNYELIPDEDSVLDLPTDEFTLDQLDENEDQAYDQMVEDGRADDTDSVEGSIIKEVMKTLALGGMLRLGSKWLKK